MTARTRELLIGMKLAHVIASLDRIADRFSADQQQRIVEQLFEIETEAAAPSHGQTVH